MKLRVAVLLALFVCLLPATARAQQPDAGVIVRVEGDVIVAEGERASVVIVIDGNATIDGVVEDFVLVIDGDVTVSGEVRGNITVISGRLILEPGSRIEDANLVDSDLEQASGATITGDIDESNDIAFRGIGWKLGVYFWVSFTIVLLVGALLLAAIAGGQLRHAATVLTSELPYSIMGTVVVWIGLPILGVLVLFTIVGIPLGLSTIFLLPLLWALGYIVTGTRLGMWLNGLIKRPAGDHPYLAAFLGVLVLQLIGLIPVLGWIVAAVAGLWGAGAIALLAWRAFRGRGAEPPATVQTPV